MVKIKFKNPIFNKGINYTVRLGEKWAKILNIGDKVNLDDVDVGIISRIDVSYFSLINPVVWIFNHDPECRKGKGHLWEVLKKIYGPTKTAGSTSSRSDFLDVHNTVVTSIEFYI